MFCVFWVEEGVGGNESYIERGMNALGFEIIGFLLRVISKIWG